MIWVKNFPLPPSVNEYLFAAVSKTQKVNKKGKAYYQGRLVKSQVHRNYTAECQWWAKLNLASWEPIRDQLQTLKKETEGRKQPFALRVDCYVAFHVERIFTVNFKCEPLDANNRLKPLLDGLVAILGIDDKHFFSGDCQKVYCETKELECTTLRISTMRPRSLTEILELARSESTPPHPAQTKP